MTFDSMLVVNILAIIIIIIIIWVLLMNTSGLVFKDSVSMLRIGYYAEDVYL